MMASAKKKNIKVVTIGGGTGSFTFLTELKDMPHVQVTAVVAMSDSGGSTGRLRVDMGVLPAGDVRQALVALSRSPDMLRELFTYRYGNGGIKGHTFGNLFLSTLEKVTDSLEEAIIQAGKLLNVRGRIYPVTLTKHHLMVEMGNGEVITGEGEVDEHSVSGYSKMYLTDEPVLNPHVAQSIADADIVLIAPGNFYCSIVPNFLVSGLTQALQESSAKKVLIVNLLTKEGHTDGFTVAKFLAELETLSAGFIPDTVVYNTAKEVTQEIQELYRSEGGELVTLGDADSFTGNDRVEFIGADIIAGSVVRKQSSADTVKRSLLRHDAAKLLKLLGLEK
jgi:uncharacterized cofD-like protein